MERVLLIGLDGATLDLVGPWVRAGKLPALARLMGEGAWGALRSTVPPATFPAWTSLMTGMNPGRHGVLDFTARVPGTYRMQFVNGSRRQVPALWTRLSAAGRRVAVLTVPATYPPEAVNGVMVSGFDSPVTTAIDGSFVYPAPFYEDIRREIGRVPFADFQEVAIGPGWHDRAIASLLDGIDRRTRLAKLLLAREQWDFLTVVFGESDTVSHHFWRFADPRSPRFAPSTHADAIVRVYEALDQAVATLVAAAGPDVTVGIVSDHGSGGAGDTVVHVNRRLEETGHLRFTADGSGGVGRRLRALALAAVPLSLQGRVLRHFPAAAGRVEGMARFGGIAWDATRAYSEELDYHPSVWLNRRDRDPHGTVSPSDVESVAARVTSDLLAWRDHHGRPVVAKVTPREEAYHGPATTEAPDLLLELTLVDGYSRSCLRSDGPGPSARVLRPDEHAAGKGAGMNGTHRPDGMFILSGPGVQRAGRVPGAVIVDIMPTVMALAGLPVPDGLDGRALTDALDAPPRTEVDPLPASTATVRPYDAAEARAVAERLAALGYLEPGA